MFVKENPEKKKQQEIEWNNGILCSVFYNKYSWFEYDFMLKNY